MGAQEAQGWGRTSGSSALAQTGVSPPTPLLSIIVLTLDSMEFVKDCLGSILPLDDRTEVLVVDGGSRDGTVPTVRKEFPGARIHVAPGIGIPQARNVGLRLASGRYVLFLDSDDRLRAGALQALIECLETESPPFVVADYTRINRDGESIGDRVTRYPDPYGGLLYNPVATLALACRRDLLRSLGGFSESFPVAEDYDMWLRLFEVAQGRRLDIYLSEHRVHGDSTSQADRLRIRMFGSRAALAAARRRQAPLHLRLLLFGHWSMDILGDLGLMPRLSQRAGERVAQFSTKMRSQLRIVG